MKVPGCLRCLGASSAGGQVLWRGALVRKYFTAMGAQVRQGDAVRYSSL
jgi:hypothetical protein